MKKMMKSCDHASTRDVRTTGYNYPVAVPPYTDENRGAHGNVCVRVECETCGAERDELRNGVHEEVSPWGLDRVARAEVARIEHAAGQEAARAVLSLALKARPKPVTVRHKTDGPVTVSIDDEGFINVRGPHRGHDALLIALQSGLVEPAARVRRAAIALAAVCGEAS